MCVCVSPEMLVVIKGLSPGGKTSIQNEIVLIYHKLTDLSAKNAYKRREAAPQIKAEFSNLTRVVSVLLDYFI